MSPPVILVYSPSPVPYAPKLLQLCALQGIRMRVVETPELDRPLAALTQEPRPAGVTAAGAPLAEPVLVFCHLTNQQLDRALLSLRHLQVFCLKAVLTPTNKAWTLRQLYAELCKERAQMGGGR